MINPLKTCKYGVSIADVQQISENRPLTLTLRHSSNEKCNTVDIAGVVQLYPAPALRLYWAL